MIRSVTLIMILRCCWFYFCLEAEENIVVEGGECIASHRIATVRVRFGFGDGRESERRERTYDE